MYLYINIYIEICAYKRFYTHTPVYAIFFAFKIFWSKAILMGGSGNLYKLVESFDCAKGWSGGKEDMREAWSGC